jgi:3-phytase
MSLQVVLLLASVTLLAACAPLAAATIVIRPIRVTAAVRDDADDPAVWINRADPSRSLILGTNKVAAPDGALCATTR